MNGSWLAPRLASAREGHVALVVRPGEAPPRVVQALLTAYDVVPVVFELEGDLDDLHLRLAALGPLDVLLDCARGAGTTRRLLRLVHHVRHGGGYLALRPDPATHRREAGRLADLLAELQAEPPPYAPARGRDRRGDAVADRAALAHSVAGLVVTEEAVTLEVAVDTLAKVRDSEADRFLALRGRAADVLATVPAASWDARAEARASSPPPLNRLPTHFDAPALSLRSYRDVVCLPRQAVLAEDFVLPESFRDSTRPRLRNPVLVDWGHGFFRRPGDLMVQAEPLAGTFVHLDPHVPEHFGHAMTEQLSHLWGWHRARELDPEVRALVMSAEGRPLPGWQVELLEAGGVPADAIVVPTVPVRVEHLLACSPAYTIGSFAHPEILDTWDRVGAALAGRAASRETSDVRRVFLTRTHGKRACRNRVEVEGWFVDAGFRVVAPENLPLPEQVRLVRGAEVVAGFAGSAMFHIALAQRPLHVIVIGSETYPAHNEHQMAALRGHRLDLVVCPPDVARSDLFDLDAFHSDFVVDPDREGRFLRSVLAEL
ncbi:MAG: glycosyltransferase family 61 protein [Nocardioides sp.]|nr:glycosyltransferase family 61 protein [Nocardioides sp.]